MKKQSTNFDRIMAGLTEAVAIAGGEADPATYRVHVPTEIDVKALRKRLGLTQAQFSARYGFKPGNVRNWEQGHRRPTGSTRAFLTVIDRETEAVERALNLA